MSNFLRDKRRVFVLFGKFRELMNRFLDIRGSLGFIKFASDKKRVYLALRRRHDGIELPPFDR